MVSQNIKLSIIIPAYLEEENLRIILPRLVNEMNKLGQSYEVLVIDAIQPIDKTQSVCDENGVIYISRWGGNNYGDAVRTGIEKATGERIIFMDADGSHAPEFISELYKYNDFDVVIASRYVDGGATDNSKILILMSMIVNLTYSLFLNLKYKDISNSFKLYQAKLLKKLKLNCNNFDVVEEILFKLKRANKDLRVKEVPFTFKKRMFGHTKRNLFLFTLSYIITIIKLRFGK